MLQRLLLLTTAALFCIFQAQAQAYEPGLLVRSNGDTLRGEIENGFWVEPPTFIRFRATAESPSQLFQPRQLRAVSFAGGRYFRYEALPIDHAATVHLNPLDTSTQPDVRLDSLLAEVLLEGPVMLWRVVRPGSTHFLLRRPNQPVLDLCERRYVRLNASGSRQLVEGNNYRGQLKIYFGDCSTAVATAQAALFTAAGIAAVVRAYHETCLPNPPLVHSWLDKATVRRRMTLQGGLVTGVRYNYFKRPFEPLPQTRQCNDCQPRPFVGIYGDLFLPSRTTAFYGEVSLSTFSNQQWAYLRINSAVSYYVVSYSAWLASARLGLRFFFPLPREQQWLFSVSYELNMALQPTVTSSSGNLLGSPNDQLRYGLPSLLPNLGLGWRSRRFTAGVDGQLYTNGDSQDLFGSLVGNNFAARLSLSYRLGRNPDVVRLAGTEKK